MPVRSSDQLLCTGGCSNSQWRLKYYDLWRSLKAMGRGAFAAQNAADGCCLILQSLDAGGYVQVLRQMHPDRTYTVMFDPEVE